MQFAVDPAGTGSHDRGAQSAGNHVEVTGLQGDTMLFIELLGTLSLRADSGAVPLVAQQKRPLGLLAVLALGGRQGLSRHRVESYLWPESEAERAGHALNQAVYAIRQSLGN